MPDWLISALRTLVQAYAGSAALWLAAHGITLPSEATDWAVLVLVAGAITAWTAGVRWLEARQGDGFGARLARGLARLLMLGIVTKPTYLAPGERARADDLGAVRKV